MTFDPTKPVQTRDGRKARIICTDAEFIVMDKSFHVVALVTDHDGNEKPRTFRGNGFIQREDIEVSDDLINIPMTRWVNARLDAMGIIQFGTAYAEKDAARREREDGDADWIACILFTEGDGL